MTIHNRDSIGTRPSHLQQTGLQGDCAVKQEKKSQAKDENSV